MQPNPQSSGFNPDQNPFEAIMGKIQGQGASQQPSPVQSGPTGGMPQQGQVPEDPTNPAVPGQTGDNTKPLIMAIQALHNYIAMSTDIRTQNIVRNLIAMLTSLVSKDQQVSAQKAESMSQSGPQEMPSMPSVK